MVVVKIKCICEYCGKIRYKFPSQRIKFCSKSCAMKGSKPRHIKLHTKESKQKMRDNYNKNSINTQFKKGHGFIKGSEKGWFKKEMKPWNYQGGIRTKSQIIKDDVRYRKWRKTVFRRDNYTCQECGKRGVKLNAHHIKEQRNYPELIFDINNGKTLCIVCHKKTENYGNRAKKIQSILS